METGHSQDIVVPKEDVDGMLAWLIFELHPVELIMKVVMLES